MIEGRWRTGGMAYRDELMRAWVDAESTPEVRAFFESLKARAKERFQQLEIWVTSHSIEVLSPASSALDRISMGFQSSDYERFAKLLRTECRHVLHPAAEEFLETLLRTSASRVALLPKGANVWRAQVGYKGIKEERDATGEWHVSYEPFPKRRMKPARIHRSDGRVNVRGIPCLYVSVLLDRSEPSLGGENRHRGGSA